MDPIVLQREGGGSSPTKSAQEVLRRMSLNSPPSRIDNPRQVKRAKLLVGGRGSGLGDGPGAGRSRGVGEGFYGQLQLSSQTPMKHRQESPRPPLDAPSPMPNWGAKSGGMSLREASYGESLEASEPNALYEPFELDCLRPPYGGASTPSPTRPSRSGNAPSGSMNADDTFEEQSPTSLRTDGATDAGTVAAPNTPLRRPGSSYRSRQERQAEEVAGGTGGRGRGGSCSPIRSYEGITASGSDARGSPVKKRGVGRWRLSGGGRDGFGGDGPMSSPRNNRNPFSPTLDPVGGEKEGSRPMAAPAPRTSVRPSSKGRREDISPMDTGEAVDFDAVAEGITRGKSDESSFLRRISAGSCMSVPETADGIRKNPDDVTKPSPCDVTEFVPITPYREGLPGLGRDRGAAGQATPMMSSPDIRADAYGTAEKGMGAFRREVKLGGVAGEGMGGDGKGRRGRFSTDFEELEIIGSGSFGTVYKVKSRVDGCLYAVKCTRRQFRGEADRQNMLREVYALAAVCDAQDTINIVRYHQAWIEDERLYIQTELCETSLEKQLEKGEQLDVPGVYRFLRQTLLGLEILHRHKLVHLDIKPGNIFVKNNQYKLGDFGLVTPVQVGTGTDVVEGDSRYMSKELLNDDHSDLTKSDVFSLGITLYEIVSGRPLPPNGEEWHRLRSGGVGMPMGLPTDLCKTLKEMMQVKWAVSDRPEPDPARRPSAAELLRYPCLQSEMERQLNDQRSELKRQRTHNLALKQEVSALIQKENQRTGRLSRTITWDNSFFSKSDSNLIIKKYDGLQAGSADLGSTIDLGFNAGGALRSQGQAPKFNAGTTGGISGRTGGSVAARGLSSVAEDGELKTS